MKKLIALFALVLAVPAFAQTAMTATTLSTAVTASATVIQVASATGITAPNQFGPTGTGGSSTLLYVDNEAMTVLSVSGTYITVTRGASATAATAHNAATVVWAAPPAVFLASDPSGACVAAQTYTPSIVPTSPYGSPGHYWNCVSSVWQPVLSTGAITPAATAAAIGTTGQTFTVNGIISGEPIVVSGAPASTSLCPLVGVRATAANTVTLYFSTLTAAACTPAAGTYLINLPRFSI